MLNSIFLFAPLRLHPLFPITIAYMLGIAWQAFEPISYGVQSLICIGMIMLAITLKSSLSRSTLMIWLVVGSFILGAYCYNYQLQQHTCAKNALGSATYDLLGTVTDIQTLDHPHFKEAIQLKVHAVKHERSQPLVPIQGTILVYSTKKNQLQIDDYIHLAHLTFSQPKSSYNDYLIKSNLINTSFTHHTTVTLLERPTYSLKRWLFTIRKELLQRLRTKMSPLTTSLFSSLFLGNKLCDKQLFTRIKNKFNIWGLAHYLARSGLHLVFFSLIWGLLLSLLPIPYKGKQSILLILGIIYLLFSWPSLSFMRAFLTFVLYKFYVMLDKQSHTLHALTLITFLNLLYNPIQLFSLEFQLSFGLTYALAWIQHVYQYHRIIKPSKPLIANASII